MKEYGYGFWLRFLTAYPSRLMEGKNAPWYFVARLSSNFPIQNNRVGDRLLAIWQGTDYYHFTTCDEPKNQWNIIQNTNFGDIEGVWTFIYYSYSVQQKRAVGFFVEGDKAPQRI